MEPRGETARSVIVHVKGRQARARGLSGHLDIDAGLWYHSAGVGLGDVREGVAPAGGSRGCVWEELRGRER